MEGKKNLKPHPLVMAANYEGLLRFGFCTSSIGGCEVALGKRRFLAESAGLSGSRLSTVSNKSQGMPQFLLPKGLVIIQFSTSLLFLFRLNSTVQAGMRHAS